MTRKERILVLLERYQEVVTPPQTFEGYTSETVLALMSETWNVPPNGYPELERLRIKLRDSQPKVYWHLSEVYFRAGRRRVAICPGCDKEFPAAKIDELHKHGQRTVVLIPRVIRTFKGSVKHEIVALAIDWLDRNWRGSVDLPDALREKAA